MKEQEYLEEIEHLIKKNEISKKVRRLEENHSLVETYWQIGRLIVEAQGGSTRAKYGNELIKKWSVKLTETYGKGYNYTNLSRFRQFYLCYPILAPSGQYLNWAHYRELLPIKDENKRNYYINLCIKNNLSKRELTDAIKSNAYERLIKKPDKIEIETPKTYSITTDMQNPIIIPAQSKVNNEHDLELNILANYVVVELKLRSLRKEDKAQMEFYMKLVDEQVKKPFHNRTIGIIITKESEKFIINFVKEDDIIPLYYELQ